MRVKIVMQSNKARSFCGFQIAPDSKTCDNAKEIGKSAVREIALSKCLNYSPL